MFLRTTRKRVINMAKNTKVSLATVREWAVEQGLVKSGQRGKLSADVIEAFEKANPGQKYDKEAAVLAKRVEVKAMRTNASGRKTPITRKVIVSEVRQAARAAGVSVPTKGRLTAPVLEAYVLDTLPALAAAQQASAAGASETVSA